MFWAYSSTLERGKVSEVRTRKRIGKSAGLDFRKEGGLGRSGGSRRAADEMADWTSRAAASISRVRANWIVMLVRPRELDEVMVSMPGMVLNAFSRGVATVEAMVSGLAPGRLAETEMVGKSTLGKSLTGRRQYARMPKASIPNMTRVVATGRLMLVSGRVMAGRMERFWQVRPFCLKPPSALLSTWDGAGFVHQ